MDNVNGDIIEAVVFGNVGGGKGMANVFDYKLVLDENITDAELLTQCQTMLIGIYNTILPMANTTTTFSHATVVNLTQDREVGSTLLSLAGSESGDSLPAGIAGGVTAYTGTRGKRGRKFIGGLNESRTSTQKWTGSALNLLAQWAYKWLIGRAFDADTKLIIPVVLSAVGEVADFFVGVSVQAIPAYQRNRKPTS